MHIWLLVIAFVLGAAAPSWAATDEFGARFAGEAPSALEDTSIYDLQNIAPAAGDEAENQTVEPVAVDSEGVLEENPAQDILKAEPEETAPTAEPDAPAAEPVVTEPAAGAQETPSEQTPAEK